MLRICLIACTAVACLVRPCFAGPRDDVDEIAELIATYYFDPVRGNEIATNLRNEAEQGSFDALTDHYDFAGELTARLKSRDAHFSVRWDGAQSTAGASGSSPPPLQMDETDAERRTNYGFVRTERLPGNIAYIDLRYVAEIDFAQSASPAQRAADAALASISGADALVLDLRQNGGGAPSMVGYLVSAFMPANADIYNTFYTRYGRDSERPAVAFAKPMLEMPLYILTSARTASAAEAIAFTLQTCHRATVVGERSAGAANPGERFSTGHGFSVFVSTGVPINPLNHRNWEGSGVVPDIAIPAAKALSRAQKLALLGVIRSKAPAAIKQDAQWALEALYVAAKPFVPAALQHYEGTFGTYSMQVDAGRLLARSGRRIPIELVPLSQDLFFGAGDPSRRFQFLRSGDVVAALEIRSSAGLFQHFNKAN